jgi:hypothetical protein
MDSSTNAPSLRRPLLRLVTLSFAALAVSFVGCTVDTASFGDPGSGTGGQNGAPSLPSGPGDTLPKTDVDCVVPEQGCLCDTSGERMRCGKVVSRKGDGQVQCSQGYLTCAGGVWGECVPEGPDTVTVNENAWSPYKVQNTQSPTPCQNNPCNPYCWNFPDGPQDAGVTDSGKDLALEDGGIGSVWDAGPGPCTPLTVAQACAGGKNCGEVANGCGGIVVCGPDNCPKAGEICGGGGVPNQCGKPPIANCTPLTKAQACTNGMNCGWVPDNCGGVVSCGNCTGQQLCGLGGPNICGDKCKPKSCNQLGKNCGLTSDGCGTTIDCGGCPAGQFCGAYSPGVCWAAGKCTPKTFAQACTNAGKNCGPIADGCGGTINCGTCASNQVCGGGGVDNVCHPACVPKTFAQACTNAGKNCGPIADGCGGLIDCGTCQFPASCGGGGVPNKCGTPANCTNLCLQQVTCPNQGQTTSITGTVYAPNGIHPLPNVVVYVPNAPVPAFPSGITCENCAQAGGSPLVSTKTNTDGTFQINNMPVGSNIPLVIQIGRWRRQITIPTVTACTNTAVSPTLTRLPKNKSEGDIPKIAVSTGCVDYMECVLRRMGIDDAEFTNPSGTGRVNFFKGGYCPGSFIGNTNSTPWESSLLLSLSTLDDYDMVLFPCQANEFYYTDGYEKFFQDNIAAYVNAGGRAFFTHYNYHWLLRRTPIWNSTLYTAINWTPGEWFNNGTLQGTLNTGFDRGLQLAQWLQLPSISGSVGFGQVLVDVTRKDFSGWDTNNTVNWLTLNNPAYPIHLTFDTPLNVAPTSKCGRVVFSDFHVYNANGSSLAFPTECPNTAMTPQEKLLEYMIFDLSSCVGSQPPPPPCQKLTCAQQGITCGQAGDGCGGTLTCGPACPVATCTPKTCAQQGAQCDSVGDGCGGILNCGTCPPNYLCSSNKCQAVSCVKDPCPTGPGTYCGPVPVGCQNDPNNTNKCPCTEPGETCGGSGITHKCGKPCVKNTCPTGPGSFCGTLPDGCGGTMLCGCTASGETCGGGGIINQCGKATCGPKSCVDQDISCGQAGDGCGNVINCGSCPAPQSCGGGGVPGKCGSVKVHSDGYFVRDYVANCPSGTAPYWQLWSWDTATPGNSFVDFTVQTATTEAGLASAPADALRYSLPPGPAALVSQVVKAQVGPPNTQVGAASVDNTLQLNGRPRHNNYLRVTTHLAPTSDKTQTSLLKLWNMQVDCIPSE